MGQVSQQIIIDSSIKKLWQRIEDFHDMSWASKVATSVIKEGDKSGFEVGAQRIVNDVFFETLLKYAPQDWTISYRVDKGPGPLKPSNIKNFIGTIKLLALEDKTQVNWTATFESENDEAVISFCNSMYQTLLKAMRESFS
ncbi:SRPBCC family protein [Aliikangiella marina]|uniref:SRPBCC family protein n=1 Tax=Aliikangiella marina TaxID=1712262 RepID=UPI00163D6080|nr:SRPBCC family protein [Aliikangiella marina]